MTIEELQEFLENEHLGLREGILTREATFLNDLGWDSLDIVEMVMSLEEYLKREIDDAVAEKWTNIGDILDWVNGVQK